MADPRISVVIAVHNGEPHIAETLESVFAQNYGNFEVVVVDDASVDGTGVILSRYEHRGLRVLRHAENRGVSAGINTAIPAVTGDYVAFLDHDDLWAPDKLQEQVRLFQAAPAVGVCFTDFVNFGDVEREYTAFQERDRAIRRYSARQVGANAFEITEESFLVAMCDVQVTPSSSATVIHRHLLERVLPLDEDVAAQDVQISFRLANQARFGYVDRVLMRRRVRSNSWGVTMGKIRWLDSHIKTLERLPRWTTLTDQERMSVRQMLSGYLRAAGWTALDQGLMKEARDYYWNNLRLEPSPRAAAYWAKSLWPSPVFRLLRALKYRLSSTQ